MSIRLVLIQLHRQHNRVRLDACAVQEWQAKLQTRDEASLERERKTVVDSEAAAAGREALQRAEKTHNETAASRSAALDRQELDLKALDKTLLEREMDLKGLRGELASERARLDDQVHQV